MRTPSDHDGLGTCWLIGGLLVAACCFWNAFPHAGLSGTTSSDSTISRVSSDHKTIPIEHIRVGDRVVTELPKEARDADRSQSLADRPTVDPHTWRLVRMRAETVWDDGTVDNINVETLQPPQWLAYHHAEVGTAVPIPLDLVEMGLPETLMAKVLAIERCPPIKDGPGQVVLTTVNHINNYVFDLTIEDKHGQTETIGVTGFHKFYSATQQAWISAAELSVGEELNGQDRMLRVASLERRANAHRVFNITVEADHVYRVSLLATLVHNNDCLPDGALVVRGGVNAPDTINIGQHPSGVVGASVESASGLTVAELAAGPPQIPNRQIGVTTVGDVRTAGGDVIPTAGLRPNHATVVNLTPEEISALLQPPQPNPWVTGGVTPSAPINPPLPPTP